MSEFRIPIMTKRVELTNLAVDGSFEDALNNWNCWLAEPTDTSQAKDGSRSLKLGGDALAGSKSAVSLIAGHKYYGREYIKTAGELTAADCRFEFCGAVDGVEKAFIFGWNRGNYPDWTIISDVITVDGTYSEGFGLRTFTVGGSCDAWVDSIVVIDLTAAFGVGAEPTKEWCDENIPYFSGSYAVHFVPKVKLINMLPAINGTDGFNNGVASTLHTKYASQSLQIDGVVGQIQTHAFSYDAYPLNSEHVYYARVEIYQEVFAGSTHFYWPIAEPVFYHDIQAIPGQWTIASAVNNRNSFTDGDYQFRIDFNNLYNEGSMWFDGLMLIDLTEAFGAGNEPSKEWCDTNIPFFVGSYAMDRPINAPTQALVKGLTIPEGVVTKIKDASGRVIWSATNKLPTEDCVIFSSATQFSISVRSPAWNGTMQFNNGGGWSTWNGSLIISGVNNNQHYIRIRGIGNTIVSGSSSGYWELNSSSGASIECSGNIETLLDYTQVNAGNHPTMANNCFAYMFEGCRFLQVAPDLPATTLSTSCYEGMFQRCTALRSTPKLPATILADSCYKSMFYMCESLTTIPALPAESLTNNCYASMFAYCYFAVSSTQTSTCTKQYRIPSAGSGTAWSTSLTNMFSGSSLATPSINTTFYLDNSITIV